MQILQVQPTMNLQDCLNSLNNNGGGILELNPSNTYYPTSDLYVYGDSTINGNGATIDFQNTAYGIKIIGTNVNRLQNCSLRELTVINSTGTGIDIQYTDNPILNLLDNVLVDNCGVGVSIDNSTAPVLIGTFSNSGVNCQISNSSSIEFHFTAFSGSTTGDGLVLTNCTDSTMFDSGSNTSLGNGISMTDCSDITFISAAPTDNTLSGIKLVSGNTRIIFNGCNITNNGNYGIDIPSGTNVDNLIVSNTFNNNTSGAIYDSGTTTKIKSNIGQVDN